MTSIKRRDWLRMAVGGGAGPAVFDHDQAVTRRSSATLRSARVKIARVCVTCCPCVSNVMVTGIRGTDGRPAVIFPHRPPLLLAEVGTPFLPWDALRFRLFEPLLLCRRSHVLSPQPLRHIRFNRKPSEYRGSYGPLLLAIPGFLRRCLQTESTLIITRHESLTRVGKCGRRRLRIDMRCEP